MADELRPATMAERLGISPEEWNAAVARQMQVPGVNGHSRPTPLDRFHAQLHTGMKGTSLPPPDPIIEHTLFTPGVSVAYGPPKSGKTFYALGMGLAIATGTPWDGRLTNQRPVVYVSAEGRGGIGSRLLAWCQFHHVDIPENFHLLTTPVNLRLKEDVDDFCRLLVELDAGFATLDTLARCTVGAEENSAKDVGLIVESLDRIRDTCGHVNVVHHSGKDIERGQRGSSALLGALDTEIQVVGDQTGFRVAITAQKDAEPTVPTWWRLAHAGPSVVATRYDPSDKDVPAHAYELSDALKAVFIDTPVSASVWRLSSGVVESSFYRAVKWLVQAGWVLKDPADGKGYRPRLAEDD